MTGEAAKQRTYKIVVLGEAKAGKSAFLRCAMKEQFDHKYQPTTVEFQTVRIELPHGNVVTLQLWDIGGGTSTASLVSTYLSNCQAVLAAYDSTSVQSFVGVLKWMDAIKAAASCQQGSQLLPYLALIACKADLEAERAVSVERHQHLAQQLDMYSYWTSSLTGEGVMATMHQIAADLVGMPLTTHELEELAGEPLGQPTGTTAAACQPIDPVGMPNTDEHLQLSSPRGRKYMQAAGLAKADSCTGALGISSGGSASNHLARDSSEAALVKVHSRQCTQDSMDRRPWSGMLDGSQNRSMLKGGTGTRRQRLPSLDAASIPSPLASEIRAVGMAALPSPRRSSQLCHASAVPAIGTDGTDGRRQVQLAAQGLGARGNTPGSNSFPAVGVTDTKAGVLDSGSGMQPRADVHDSEIRSPSPLLEREISGTGYRKTRSLRCWSCCCA